MKFAIVAFTNPFVDKSDGGKIDIYNRLLALSDQQTKIDLYTILKKDERETTCEFKNVNVYADRVANKFKYVFNKYPLSVNNRYSNKLTRIMKEKVYDLTIFENANMIKYLDKNNIISKINYIRIHNIESSYRKDTFKSSFPKLTSILEGIEGMKYKNIENNYINKFSKFLFISKDEQNEYIKLFPKYKEKFIWVPPVIECNKYVDYNAIEDNTILFYGDMTISHNFEGIKWFCKKVFPKVLYKNPNVILNIVGKISSYDRQYLSKAFNNINVLGYVENIDKTISEAAIVIAPIFHGAGVKIKVLHALSKGKILVATEKAIEGTYLKDKEHLFIGKDADEFTKLCLKILSNSKKYIYAAENALKYLKQNHSIKSQSELLYNLYKEDIRHVQINN
jgi:glycosyltransferase involved in cell wall biosynthesis